MKKIILAIALLTSAVGCAQSDDSKAKTINATAQQNVFGPVDTTHAIAGTLQIEDRNGQRSLVFNDDFTVSSGPDLRVVLRDSTGTEPMVVLDMLKAFSGRQEYPLVISEDLLEKFDQVVIYCAKFHVDFGVAGI